jgi:hypothetical protein
MHHCSANLDNINPMSIGLEFQTFVRVWSISADRERQLLQNYRQALNVPNNSLATPNPTPLALQALQNLGQTLKQNGHLKYFPKGTTLHRCMTGFQIVADGADIEFVTDPVPMGATGPNSNAFFGEDHLKLQMSSVTHFARRLNHFHTTHGRPGTTNFICRADNPILFSQFPPFLLEWHTIKNKDLEGFPQVTGGITLQRLRKMFRYFAQNADSRFSKDLLGGNLAQTYARSIGRFVENLRTNQIADQNWPGHHMSASMRGFVSIVGMYLAQGKLTGFGDRIPVVKQLLFLMARTDFGTMFEQLPNDEKQHYRNAPNDWVHFICTQMMPLIDPQGGYTANLPMFEYKIHDYNHLGQGHEIIIPITREEWLKGMLRGVDLFSERAHPIKKWKDRANRHTYRDAHGEHRLRGAGALGSTLDHIVVGNLAKNAIIFEFRAPGHDGMSMPYDRWTEYAVSCFRFLAALNIHSKSEKLEDFEPAWLDLEPLF